MVDIRHFQEKAQVQLPYLGVAENKSSDNFLFFSNLRDEMNYVFAHDDNAPYLNVEIERHEKSPYSIQIKIETRRKEEASNCDDMIGYLTINFQKTEDSITVNERRYNPNNELTYCEKNNHTYSAGGVFSANILARSLILEKLPNKYKETVNKIMILEFRKLNDRDIIDAPLGVQL